MEFTPSVRGRGVHPILSEHALDACLTCRSCVRGEGGRGGQGMCGKGIGEDTAVAAAGLDV